MEPSRREFLKGCGALIVTFSASSLTQLSASGQGPFAPHLSHVDPTKLDSWLAVGADGTITAYTGKCDFGQGMFTAQTQLVAEELVVPIARVRLIECDTSVTPDQGTTSGSQSTPTNFNSENLALAAATAREALLSLAAQKLGEPVEAFTLADGVITGKRGRQVKYEELVETSISASAQRDRKTAICCAMDSAGQAGSIAGHRSPDDWPFRVRWLLPRAGDASRPRRAATRNGSYGCIWDGQSVRDLPGLKKVVVRKDFIGVVAATQYQAVRAARRLVRSMEPRS